MYSKVPYENFLSESHGLWNNTQCESICWQSVDVSINNLWMDSSAFHFGFQCLFLIKKYTVKEKVKYLNLSPWTSAKVCYKRLLPILTVIPLSTQYLIV